MFKTTHCMLPVLSLIPSIRELSIEPIINLFRFCEIFSFFQVVRFDKHKILIQQKLRIYTEQKCLKINYLRTNIYPRKLMKISPTKVQDLWWETDQSLIMGRGYLTIPWYYCTVLGFARGGGPRPPISSKNGKTSINLESWYHLYF